jgi:hypothetical protein
VRYTKLFGDMVVDTIDGDALIIALLAFERSMRERRPDGSRKDLREVPQMQIYRIVTQTEEMKGAKKKAAAAAAAEAKKGGTAESLDAPEGRKTPHRVYEYVDIGALYYTLVGVLNFCKGRSVVLTDHDGYEMQMLAALIGLTGSDFTRNLPLISGNTLYEMLETLWLPLASCFNVTTGQLRVQMTTDVIVSMVYAEKFRNHVGDVSGFDYVRAKIMDSKLGERTKLQFPSRDRVVCTIRNINWVLKYWECADETPDAVQDEFGYSRWPAPKGRKQPGKVGYLDEIEAEAE